MTAAVRWAASRPYLDKWSREREREREGGSAELVQPNLRWGGADARPALGFVSLQSPRIPVSTALGGKEATNKILKQATWSLQIWDDLDWDNLVRILSDFKNTFGWGGSTQFVKIQRCCVCKSLTLGNIWEFWDISFVSRLQLKYLTLSNAGVWRRYLGLQKPPHLFKVFLLPLIQKVVPNPKTRRD